MNLDLDLGKIKDPAEIIYSSHEELTRSRDSKKQSREEIVMRLLKERRERTNKPQSDVHTTTTHSVGYSPPVVDQRRVEAAREEDFNPESLYSEDMISQKAGEISASRPQMLFTEAMEKYYDGCGTS